MNTRPTGEDACAPPHQRNTLRQRQHSDPTSNTGFHSTVSVLGCQGKCPERPFVSALWTHATVMDAFGVWDGALLVPEPAAAWSLQLPHLV